MARCRSRLAFACSLLSFCWHSFRFCYIPVFTVLPCYGCSDFCSFSLSFCRFNFRCRRHFCFWLDFCFRRLRWHIFSLCRLNFRFRSCRLYRCSCRFHFLSIICHNCRCCRCRVERIRIRYDFPVFQIDYTCSVFIGKIRVVCDHHNQAVTGNLLQKLHDLYSCRTVECACRLVCQNYVRIVHQRTRDRDSLHLASGKLHRKLVDMLRKTYFSKRFLSAGFSFTCGNTTDSKCKLYVLQYSLMRNQVIALEHESDRVVPVRIPVAVFVFCRGNTVDH